MPSQEIKAAAKVYAREELGRKVRIPKVIDLGATAMALCRAHDAQESFALVLEATIADHRWYVIDETSVEDFKDNAKRFGAIPV